MPTTYPRGDSTHVDHIETVKAAFTAFATADRDVGGRVEGDPRLLAATALEAPLARAAGAVAAVDVTAADLRAPAA
jgi:hypothetical protein